MFNILIRNVANKDVGNIIAGLPKRTSYTLNHTVDEAVMQVKTKYVKRASVDAALTMTGKTAQKGSAREKMMTVFEKLEVKKGVGHVTRKMFRAELKKKKLNPHIITQLLADGFLKHLS